MTGVRPLEWNVEGLPDGVVLDDDGVLRGTAPAEPEVRPLSVRVRNELGVIDEQIELCIGDALALTPPMGWNSWNVYGAEVTAEVVMRMADAMVDLGMRDLGYQYVNIDDHWHAEARSSDGRPLANPRTFPDGIGAVADHVHRLGLKLGIYSDAAPLTCGGCFGGFEHERLDAETYAAWGIDLLKYDYCYAPIDRSTAMARYGTMSRALADSGRSIVFSVCEWGWRKPWLWAPGLGASYWRTTPDIFDSFSWGPGGVRGIARRNVGLDGHAGPGRWNDPDMLLVGNRGAGHSTSVMRTRKNKRQIWRFRGIDEVQVQTQMSLWAMMAAPLLASHDLVESTDHDRAMLMNPEILAIDQDVLGIQGHKHGAAPGLWILAKPLHDGATAVSVTNMTRFARSATVPLSDVGVGLATSASITDAWAQADLGEADRLVVRLRPYESAVYICRPVDG